LFACTNLSLLPHESFETGPLPNDLMPGYLAAVAIANLADSLSQEVLGIRPKITLRYLHSTLKDLALGDPDEISPSLAANAQEINAVRDRPARYDNIVYPNVHLVCYEIWSRLLFHAWALAGELGLPNGSCCEDRWDFDKFDLSAFKERHGRAIWAYFHRLGLPRTQDLLAELQLELSKVAQRRRDAKSSGRPAAEDDDYQLAHEVQGLWLPHFGSYNSFKRALDKSPVRTISKGRRLRINVTDLLTFLKPYKDQAEAAMNLRGEAAENMARAVRETMQARDAANSRKRAAGQ
jgi:hypothetical protein